MFFSSRRRHTRYWRDWSSDVCSSDLTTSLTVIFTLLALLLFGGATIRTFILVLLVGIISGTYSSIFVASQLLVEWEHGTFSRPFQPLLRRLPRRRAARSEERRVGQAC